MSKKKKKSKCNIEGIALAIAIINLIIAIVDLLIKLIN